MFKKTQEALIADAREVGAVVKTGARKMSMSTVLVAIAVSLISLLLLVNTITMVKVAYL